MITDCSFCHYIDLVIGFCCIALEYFYLATDHDFVRLHHDLANGSCYFVQLCFDLKTDCDLVTDPCYFVHLHFDLVTDLCYI